jgi:alpha-beta hydrolase superfamily lysophospholipase
MDILLRESSEKVKLNWIPDEFMAYRLLKFGDGDAIPEKFHTTCRYRLPREWKRPSDITTLKKVMVVVNSINNTWYHYQLSRLLPDWLIVTIDIRHNGYDSSTFLENADRDQFSESTRRYVDDIQECYDDIAFCYDYFGINRAENVVLYGYNIGALVALGFYKQYRCSGSAESKYRVTHMVLNAPYLVIPDRVTRALSQSIFNPLSRLLPASTTQQEVVAQTYDGISTIAVSHVPRFLAFLSMFGGMIWLLVGSLIMLVAKFLLNAFTICIPNESLRNYNRAFRGTVAELSYVSAQQRNFYISAGTISPVVSSQTLLFGKSLTDVQNQLRCNTGFIKCPLFAMFSATVGDDNYVIKHAADNEYRRGTADECIGLLRCMSREGLVTAYKFSDVYNDALLSNDLLVMSKSIFSLLVWLQINDIELLRDDGSVMDMTDITVNDINLYIDELLTRGSDIPSVTPAPSEGFYSNFALIYEDLSVQNSPDGEPSGVWAPSLRPILLPMYVNTFNQLGTIFRRPASIPANFYTDSGESHIVMGGRMEENIVAAKTGVYSIALCATAQSNLGVNANSYVVAHMYHVPVSALSANHNLADPTNTFLESYIVKPERCGAAKGSLCYTRLPASGQTGSLATNFTIYMRAGDILTLPRFTSMPTLQDDWSTGYTPDTAAHWIRNGDEDVGYQYTPEQSGQGGVYYTDGNFKITTCTLTVEFFQG